MFFEWDSQKNEYNKKRHHISFEHASLVFNDEFRVEHYDTAHSDDEERYNIIGKVKDILFVVVVYKTADTVRIISARKANKQERIRMALVRMTMEEIMRIMTPERIEHETEEALRHPIAYDEDCPAQTAEQLSHFRPAIKKSA